MISPRRFSTGWNSEDPDKAKRFEDGLKGFFRENGIGWAMEKGQIVVSGSEAFSAMPKQAIELLGQTGRQTAAKEIHEAIQDLSRRPKPDVTGSIQHAMASLECVMRDVTDQPGKTLDAHSVDRERPFRPIVIT